MRHSYSKISTYMKCPLQMKGKYILKIRDERGPAAQRGIDIHKQFESAVQLQLPLPDEFNFYDEYVKKLAGSSCELKVAVDRDWQPLPYDDPNAWLVGIIDLWTVRADRGTLLDWKTGKEYPDHVMQKEFYVALIGDHHPEVEIFETTNVYVDQKTVRTHRFTRGDLENLRERWGNRIRRMEADDQYPATPGPYCRWCPVSHKKGGPCGF